MYNIGILIKRAEPKQIEKIDSLLCDDIMYFSDSQYSAKPFEPFPNELNNLDQFRIFDKLDNEDEIIYEYTVTTQIRISKVKETEL